MGVIDRLFDVWRGLNPLRGKERPEDPDVARERARRLSGTSQPALQTLGEQAGVRDRMEAELDSQRRRRAQMAHPQT